MYSLSIAEFINIIVPNKKVIGIDMGIKKIGIAFANTSVNIAFPHSVYMRSTIERDLDALRKLMSDNNASIMVVGLPLSLSGEENLWCKKVRDFVYSFYQRYKISTYLQDERFSTAMTYHILKHLSRRKAQNRDDCSAAACILQQTLNIINNIKNT